jgi:hypothetical protein
MDIGTLLLLGGIIVALAIGAFFGLIFFALLIYVVSHLYPWLRKIAVWAAKPENLLPLLVLAGGLIILIIFAGVLLHALLLLVLIIFPLLLFFPIDLGLLVWVVRLIRWLYRKYRGVLVSIYTAMRLQLIKAKIKTDVHKGKDWDTKFAEMKSKLSAEAEQARRKISRGGK